MSKTGREWAAISHQGEKGRVSRFSLICPNQEEKRRQVEQPFPIKLRKASDGGQ